MTSKTSPPYMPTYPTDELAIVNLLDADAVGVYYRLRCNMWINGGKIENKTKVLLKAAGVSRYLWPKIKEKLSHLLVEDGQNISLIGLEAEYKKCEKKRQNLAKNGSKGGIAKRENIASLSVENREISENNSDENRLANGVANARDFARDNATSVATAGATVKNADSPGHPSSSPNHNQIKKMDDDPPGNVDNSRRRGTTNGFQSLGTMIGHFEDDSLLKVRQVFSEHGLRPPPDWHVLNQWVQFGADMDRDILPVLQQVCARVAQKGVSPPKSFNYFEDAVTRQINKHAGNF